MSQWLHLPASEIVHLPVAPCTLIAGRPGSIRILFQANQNLPHSFLVRIRILALATQIHQFRYPLPARATRTGIFSACQEFFGLSPRLGNGLFLLGVVRLVEGIDRRLRGFDGCGLAVSRTGSACIQSCIALLAPRSADFGLFFVFSSGDVGRSGSRSAKR